MNTLNTYCDVDHPNIQGLVIVSRIGEGSAKTPPSNRGSAVDISYFTLNIETSCGCGEGIVDSQ